MAAKKKYIKPAFVVRELEVGSILECLYDVYSGQNGCCIDEPLESAFLRMLKKHLAVAVSLERIKNKLRNGFCDGEPKEQYVCRMKEELRI